VARWNVREMEYSADRGRCLFLCFLIEFKRNCEWVGRSYVEMC
jgi:hypothetical protein